MDWQALIGTNGIETKADLAKYLGISRASVTYVLKRLVNAEHNRVRNAKLVENQRQNLSKFTAAATVSIKMDK